MKVFDLAYQGWLPAGFVGAATFEVLGVEQLCDRDGDGHVDQEPVMPSTVVMNYGWAADLQTTTPFTATGDLCRIYESIPFSTGTFTVTSSADAYPNPIIPKGVQ
jgi:hypothetical protein